MIEEVKRLGIRSIAVPPFGCGNGHLDWADVRPRIAAAFAQIPDVRLLLFAPQGVRTPRPCRCARVFRPEGPAAV